MQQFNNSIELPASADTVIAAITSEDYIRFRYQESGIADFELDVQHDDADRFDYEVRRHIDVSGRVPKIAQRLVGDEMIVVQKQQWSRGGPDYKGLMLVQAEGLPGKIETDVSLHPVDNQRCRLSAEGRIQVNIRIIGNQLEKMMLGRAKESFSDSAQAIQDYLARR